MIHHERSVRAVVGVDRGVKSDPDNLGASQSLASSEVHAQPPTLDLPLHQVGEAGLVDGRRATLQTDDRRGLGIPGAHAMPGRGRGRRGDRPEVPQPEDGDVHATG